MLKRRAANRSPKSAQKGNLAFESHELIEYCFVVLWAFEDAICFRSSLSRYANAQAKRRRGKEAFTQSQPKWPDQACCKDSRHQDGEQKIGVEDSRSEAPRSATAGEVYTQRGPIRPQRGAR